MALSALTVIRHEPKMESTTNIFLSVIFGAIGTGYIVYGRRQKRIIAFICGVALCAYPYFISNTILVIIVGIVLMILPFYLRD